MDEYICTWWLYRGDEPRCEYEEAQICKAPNPIRCIWGKRNQLKDVPKGFKMVKCPNCEKELKHMVCPYCMNEFELQSPQNHASTVNAEGQARAVRGGGVEGRGN
jgi:ribosomal protein L32